MPPFHPNDRASASGVKVTGTNVNMGLILQDKPFVMLLCRVAYSSRQTLCLVVNCAS